MIPGGGSASYQMRVAVPATAKTGLERTFEPVPSKPDAVADVRIQLR